MTIKVAENSKISKSLKTCPEPWKITENRELTQANFKIDSNYYSKANEKIQKFQNANSIAQVRHWDTKKSAKITEISKNVKTVSIHYLSISPSTTSNIPKNITKSARKMQWQLTQNMTIKVTPSDLSLNLHAKKIWNSRNVKIAQPFAKSWKFDSNK